MGNGKRKSTNTIVCGQTEEDLKNRICPRISRNFVWLGLVAAAAGTKRHLSFLGGEGGGLRPPSQAPIDKREKKKTALQPGSKK